jgi:hypothetical protein
VEGTTCCPYKTLCQKILGQGKSIVAHNWYIQENATSVAMPVVASKNLGWGIETTKSLRASKNFGLQIRFD